MQEMMIKRAKELLADGTVTRVIGWKKGEFAYDITPAVFTTAEELDRDFIYNDFCGANVSKYLVAQSQKPGAGKILAFLRPDDSYSFSQLITEHRIVRENVYAIGIPAGGLADVDKIKARGISGITGIESDGDDFIVNTIYGDERMPKSEVLAERAVSCLGKKHIACDEIMGDEADVSGYDRNLRFEMVEKLENMTAQERYDFWKGQLSKCIRCNACRNVCPACTCEKCVFDNPKSGIAQKAAADSFEENMFHIIRAFHVAGRCTDCGQCSRVCPEKIPLHLLNRKFIKDINSLYGEYQAGEEIGNRSPLTSYTQEDAEPKIVHERGAE